MRSKGYRIAECRGSKQSEKDCETPRPPHVNSPSSGANFVMGGGGSSVITVTLLAIIYSFHSRTSLYSPSSPHPCMRLRELGLSTLYNYESDI